MPEVGARYEHTWADSPRAAAELETQDLRARPAVNLEQTCESPLGQKARSQRTLCCTLLAKPGDLRSCIRELLGGQPFQVSLALGLAQGCDLTKHRFAAAGAEERSYLFEEKFRAPKHSWSLPSRTVKELQQLELANSLLFNSLIILPTVFATGGLCFHIFQQRRRIRPSFALEDHATQVGSAPACL